jgi:hypothetical protein
MANTSPTTKRLLAAAAAASVKGVVMPWALKWLGMYSADQ